MRIWGGFGSGFGFGFGTGIVAINPSLCKEERNGSLRRLSTPHVLQRAVFPALSVHAVPLAITAGQFVFAAVNRLTPLKATHNSDPPFFFRLLYLYKKLNRICHFSLEMSVVYRS